MENAGGEPVHFDATCLLPDLFACGASPDFLRRQASQKHQDCVKDLSLEDETMGFATDCLDVSFKLPTASGVHGDKGPSCTSLSINAGEPDESVVYGDIDFQKDIFFIGGDTIRTDEKIGEGRGLALYQTARFGDFSYEFHTLAPGDYLIDLHLAEIIFTQGPPGMRTFDVFMQEQKVVSGLDIYAAVGSNKPLVISDLSTTVTPDGGLVIRFEGINGSPLVCGISIRSDSSEGKRLQRPVEGSMFQFVEQKATKDDCHDCEKLKHEYEILCNMQADIKKALEDSKKENELKSRECHEAWMSLQGLQNELMRKSMHVGSLAFAVEGQVKEKTRWFSAIRELSNKLKLLKIEHAELSKGASEYQKCLADMASMTTSIQSAMKGHALLGREHEDLKEKFIKEANRRKELYNKVLEMKGNIRVFCRCRPLNIEETSRGVPMVVDFESSKDGDLTLKAPGVPKKVFKFDSVFSPEANQESVFEDTSPLATSVLDGYNVCIFAYGQTGTGKTFTMEGTTEARGVNYKTLDELFRIIQEREAFFRYNISVSVLEVYNEQIRDLLLADSQPGVAAKRLEIRQVADGVHHIPGLVEASVTNMNEVWEVLRAGSNARAVGSTNANEHSSRSHCIHCVMVKGENLITGECIRSKLWLIDLAGSERVAKTDVQGERLKEAQSINRSLSALGDVISALATKSPHIPFRNSKLTHLLQDSLGGDSKALMFVQISPSESDVSETLCSLNFASRVRGIELGPSKKQIDSSEMSRYKQMLEKAKQDIKGKDGNLKKMEETIYCMESKLKAKDAANKTLQDKVKELESQLLIERRLARQHVDTKLAEHQLQQQKLLQHRESCKIPVANRPLPDHQNKIEEQVTAFREISNVVPPLAENNNRPIPLPQQCDNFSRNFPRLKENKSDVVNEAVPRKLSRLSFCATTRTVAPIVPAPRRSSLIPFPAAATMVAPLHSIATTCADSAALTPSAQDKDEFEDENMPNERRSVKKHNSISRRSLQKKVVIRPPVQQQQVGRGVVGLEKGARLSAGSTGRKARRVPVISRGVKGTLDREEQQKRLKERGWNNHGKTVRSMI